MASIERYDDYNNMPSMAGMCRNFWHFLALSSVLLNVLSAYDMARVQEAKVPFTGFLATMKRT